MAKIKKDSEERRSVILLQKILKRNFKGSYGVAKSKVHLDKLILCAEFDLEYHYFSKEAPNLKQNRWYREDSEGRIVEWPVKEYLKCFSERRKANCPPEGDPDPENIKGAHKLYSKVNNTLQQMRKILRHINFETKEYCKTPINSENDIKWVFDNQDGEYIYNPTFNFNIEPYVEKYLMILHGVSLTKKAQSLPTISIKNNRNSKLDNSQENLMVSMNNLHENMLMALAPYLKDMPPREVENYLEEHVFSKLRASTNKTIYDKNLKDKISLIISICDAKPRGWLKRCINLLDEITYEYKDFVSPLVYSDLLIFNANFITKYGLTDNFKQHKKLPVTWITAIGNIYKQAIEIARANMSYETEIKYLLEYATFLYDNRQFHLAGRYYWDALRLCHNTFDLDNFNSKKANADALYYLALYHEELNELTKAQEGYEASLELRRELAEMQDKYRGDVAKTLNNLGNLYKTLFEYDKAEKCLSESYEIYKYISKGDPKYKIHRVISRRNLALVLYLQGNYHQALNEINGALKTISELAQKDPNEYNCDLAYLLLDYAILYSKKNNYIETNDKYNKALNLFSELAILNPHKHRGRLAWTLNTYVIFHHMDNLYTTTALDYYTKALEMYEELSQEFTIAYDSSIGRALNLLGDIYYRLKDYEKSEGLQTRAYDIYSKLAKENPSKYDTNTAWTLNLLAITYYSKGLKEQAIKANQTATKIYETALSKGTNTHTVALEWSKSIYNLLLNDSPIEFDCSIKAMDIYISDLLRRSRRHLL